MCMASSFIGAALLLLAWLLPISWPVFLTIIVAGVAATFVLAVSCALLAGRLCPRCCARSLRSNS